MKENKKSEINNEDITNHYSNYEDISVKNPEEIKNLNMKKMEKKFEKTVTNTDEMDYLRQIYMNSILKMDKKYLKLKGRI